MGTFVFSITYTGYIRISSAEVKSIAYVGQSLCLLREKGSFWLRTLKRLSNCKQKGNKRFHRIGSHFCCYA